MGDYWADWFVGSEHGMVCPECRTELHRGNAAQVLVSDDEPPIYRLCCVSCADRADATRPVWLTAQMACVVCSHEWTSVYHMEAA